MEKIIRYEDLRKFSYSNDKICKKPIKGIVISFPWLNQKDIFDEDPNEGRIFAEKNILYIKPYSNPWSWMNQQAVEFTDEILDVLFQKYNLADNLPIVSSGSSMGGQSALVYMAYAKRTPVACVVNCPVCDLPFHFTERNDLPRTLYSAFGTYHTTMDEALKSASPIHLYDKMPQANYYIFQCECDQSVNKKRHSDVFVPMLNKKFRVVYHTIPERGHCELTDEMRNRFIQYMMESIEKG